MYELVCIARTCNYYINHHQRRGTGLWCWSTQNDGYVSGWMSDIARYIAINRSRTAPWRCRRDTRPLSDALTTPLTQWKLANKPVSSSQQMQQCRLHELRQWACRPVLLVVLTFIALSSLHRGGGVTKNAIMGKLGLHPNYQVPTEQVWAFSASNVFWWCDELLCKSLTTAILASSFNEAWTSRKCERLGYICCHFLRYNWYKMTNNLV